jgi:hypothetical protein
MNHVAIVITLVGLLIWEMTINMLYLICWNLCGMQIIYWVSFEFQQIEEKVLKLECSYEARTLLGLSRFLKLLSVSTCPCLRRSVECITSNSLDSVFGRCF